jgi:hypothetical protein
MSEYVYIHGPDEGDVVIVPFHNLKSIHRLDDQVIVEVEGDRFFHLGTGKFWVDGQEY